MQWILGILGLLCGAAVAGGFVYLWMDRRGRAAREVVATQAALAEQRCVDLSQRLECAIGESNKSRQLCSEAQQRCAALEAELRASQQNLADQRKSLDEAQGKLREAFAGLSAEALSKNNEAFLQL